MASCSYEQSDNLDILSQMIWSYEDLKFRTLYSSCILDIKQSIKIFGKMMFKSGIAKDVYNNINRDNRREESIQKLASTQELIHQRISRYAIALNTLKVQGHPQDVL